MPSIARSPSLRGRCSATTAPTSRTPRPRTRAALGDRLERALQGVDLRGITVKRNQAENLSARAAAANRISTLAPGDDVVFVDIDTGAAAAACG